MRTRLFVAALPLLLAAACGSAPSTAQVASAGEGGTASAQPSASATLSRDEAQLKFAQCMRENGVDMPDPDANGGIRIQGKKGEQDKTEAAMKACKQYLDQAAGERKAMDPERRDQLVKFAQCMREHGVQMEDPGADGMIKMLGNQGDEQTMKAAQEACKEFAPGMMKGGGS
ncbi:hypothetical protein ACFXJ8_02670 [Nonomuraea sp. NPDC059194]|uniref:hypothetical protein n=1 Tax=Nonomuraea sp. NPDC059194 TaxID=3346764 RepID=UPI0036755760